MALVSNLIVAISGLAIQGIYQETLIARAFIIAPIFIISAILGQYLYGYAPVSWFRPAVYAILILSAVSL